MSSDKVFTIESRKYEKNKSFENGIKLTQEPCIFTNSAKASEMRGVMSCGHPVECMNLFSYFYHSVLHDKYDIRCPALKSSDPKDVCNKKWTYDELRRMCLLTPKDREFFEVALNLNIILSDKNVKRCRRCQSFVRKNEHSDWVLCQGCSITDSNNSYYCFNCEQDRSDKRIKTAGDGHMKCTSDACVIGDNLAFTVPKKKICGELVDMWQRCPNPVCGVWVEHAGPSYCKWCTCVCKYRFCFLCRKGGNMNNFVDCTSVDGGCAREEGVLKLKEKKKEKPLPEAVLHRNQILKRQDED